MPKSQGQKIQACFSKVIPKDEQKEKQTNRIAQLNVSTPRAWFTQFFSLEESILLFVLFFSPSLLICSALFWLLCISRMFLVEPIYEAQGISLSHSSGELTCPGIFHGHGDNW